MFVTINCTDVFERNEPIVNFKTFLEYAKNCLKAKQETVWLTTVQNKPKLHGAGYSMYQQKYETEMYCMVNLNRSQRSALAKLRLGILPINVELGRHTGIPRDERYCIFCKDNVEDEVHVMLYCPLYDTPPQLLFNAAKELCNGFYILSDLSKIGLLTSHTNVICKTANFVNNVLDIRQKLLRV